MLKVIIYSTDPGHSDLLEACLPKFSTLFRASDEDCSHNCSLSIVDIEHSNWKSIIKTLRRRSFSRPVLALAPPEKVRDIIDAIRHGACDWLKKPVSPGELEKLLSRIFCFKQADPDDCNHPEFASLIGKHPLMLELRRKILKYAPDEHPVLINGESGTGKGLVAEIIHRLSLRNKGKFVPGNCGTFPPALIESELFGTRAGSYTGAVNRKGAIELSDGGTFFLDEIGELPPESQVKLLKVIEEKRFFPLGNAGEPVYSDTRFIAATNRDIEQMVGAGTFREDLYYRINILRLTIPPLRERKSDIPLLIEFFLKDKEIGIEHRAVDLLMDHPWPGNIRELAAVLTRAAIHAEGDCIHSEDIVF